MFRKILFKINMAAKEMWRKMWMRIYFKQIPFAFLKQEFLRPLSGRALTNAGTTFRDSGGTTGDVRNEDANLDED